MGDQSIHCIFPFGNVTFAQVAPILTVFIGGNHEASNHLWELPYGGWYFNNLPPTLTRI